MKNFYKVSNTIENGPRMDRKRTVVGPMKDRVKSRISPINHRLWTVIAPMLFVAFGLFGVNEEMWALDEYVNVSYFNGYTKFSGSGNSGTGLNQVSDGTFSATQNLVTFSINNVSKYDNKRLCFGDQSYNTTKNVTFSWATTSTDYSVTVSRIDAKIRAYSVAKYNSSAWFEGHSANGYSTNSLGTEGAGDIYATSNLGGSSTILYLKNAETKAGFLGAPKNLEYTLHDIKFTYQVTYKQYLYGFEAILGGVNNSAYGSATVSGKDTVRNNFSPLTKATKQVSFTASVKDSKKYKFLGWYTDAACTTEFVSSANPYTPTLENSKAGTFVTQTLYAKFGEKGQPSVTCNIASTYEVGHEEIDLQALWTREGNGAVTYSIVPNSFEASGINNDGASTPALRDGRYLSFGQAGTLQLKMEIEADGDEYLARSETKNITINKISNSLKCAWDGGAAGSTWTYDVSFDTPKSVLFSSTTASPKSIVVNRLAGEDVVRYNASAHLIETLNKEGYAEWTVSQEENYMYASASETFRVNVGTTTPSTPCYVLANQSSDKSVWHGETTHEHTWNDERAAGTVNFQIYHVAGSIDPGYKVQQYVDKDGDGSWNWEDVTNQRVDHGTSWSWKSDELDHSAKGVRIWGSGSLYNHVKNVSVTRYGRIDTENENGAAISSVTMPENVKGGVTKTKSFYIDYSTCADYIKVVSRNPRLKFTASNDTVYEFLSNHYNAHKEIEVAYISPLNEGENLNETITIYTPYEYKSIIITGHTKEILSTHLEYKGEASYAVNATNIAAMDLFEVRDENNDVVEGAAITLSEKEETNVVDLANSDTELDPNCGGNTTIIAHYAGDDETYAAAEDLEREITITRLADEISFGNGKIVLIADNEEELSAWNITSSSQTEGATLTFSTSNSGVLRVEGGKIIAVSKGEAKLYATSENTCTYAAGVDSLTIKVRNTNDPCETTSYLNTAKTQIKSGKSLVATITEGMHQTLTVSVRAQLLAANSNTSTIELLNKDNGVLFTHTFKRDSMSMTPKTYSYNLSGIANIETAKTIRVTGNGTTYYQEYDLIKITQQRYLNHTGAKNIAMTSVKACEEATHDIAINYSDVSTIQLNHQNSDFSYTVVNGNSNGEFNNDCGDFGTFTLRATVHPLSKGLYKDSIFLSAAGLQDTIVLSLEATKPDREIVWTIDDICNATATTNTTLDASVRTTLCQETAGSVTYTIHAQSSEGVASLSGNVLSFHKQGTVTVKASAAETDDYLAASDVTKTWNVSKVGVQMTKLPTITSTITCGDTKSVVTYDNDSWVAVSVLNDKDTVQGYIVYVEPNNFNTAGPQDLTFNFYPTIVNTYDVLQFTVPVTVQQIASVATPVAANITYGHRVNESVLSSGAGSTTPGTWSWKDEAANTQVLDASADAYTGLNVIFTPYDSNYSTIETTVSLKVDKADPEATVSNVGITYGATASSVTLSGTGDGEWSWDDSRATQTLAAGVYDDMAVKFTPTDGDNYNELSTTITLTVSKADPVATANAVEITYGATALSVDLEGTGVAGTWSWTDTRKDQVLAVGEYTMNVHFKPTNLTNYNEKDATVALTVKKADPVASANAVEITYGAKASSVDLEGTGVAGTWSWTDTRKDDVLAAGSYTMDVHFVPTEATNYNEKDATVALTVKKATTTLSWTSNPTDLAYNATDAVYTATSASDGAITYSIISGGSYAHIDANTGALTIDLPGNTITIQAEQAEGTNYSAPTAITVEVTIAAAPVGPNSFTGNGEWENPSNWSTGIVPTTAEPDIIVVGQLVINEEKTVGGLTIMPTGGVTIVDDGKLTVNGTTTTQTGGYGDIHVKDDGALVLGNSADLQVRDFMLDAKLGDGATRAASGQVRNEERMNINGEVYFQLSFDPSNAITFGWYDFAVPFAVNINGGITRIGSIDDRVMVSGVDFLIMEDDEVDFAAGGHGWRIMSSNGVLVPGKLYTISFNYQASLPQNTFQFAWNKQGTITNGTSYNAEYIVSSDDARTGWNAIGNGMLCHGYVDASYKLQTYNHTDNVYEIVYDPKTFAVGTAFFVQVLAAGDIDWTAAEATPGRPLYAPQREAKDIDEFRLSLRSESNDAVNDVLFFSASEEAVETYMIGHDLLKKGTPTEAKKAQMWTVKNGKNLCDVEAMLVNDEATTPLNLYAPNAGQYILAIEEMPEDATLYLTYNGNVIWDLTASPYVLDLTKGTTTGYALRIVAANAPQITTGVDDVQGDGAQVRKVIIDNKMYIITSEGAIFDAIGKKVQ